MHQVLIEKFYDVLFPVLCAIAVWFALHYFILAPRIMKVEMPIAYETSSIRGLPIPDKVHDCLRRNYADALLNVGRFEAALYTASLKYAVQAFNRKSVEALSQLDTKCGTTKALEAEKERLRLAEERRKERQKLRAQRLLEEQNREAERLRQEAIARAKEKQIQIYVDMFNMIFGGRR